MEPMQMVEKVEGTANPRTSSGNSNSSSDRSYLEVIDIDDDYPNPSSFSVSDISLSNELEDSKILGIKFDSICLTIISPRK
jgi:hypothetical protein